MRERQKDISWVYVGTRIVRLPQTKQALAEYLSRDVCDLTLKPLTQNLPPSQPHKGE